MMNALHGQFKILLKLKDTRNLYWNFFFFFLIIITLFVLVSNDAYWNNPSSEFGFIFQFHFSYFIFRKISQSKIVHYIKRTLAKSLWRIFHESANFWIDVQKKKKKNDFEYRTNGPSENINYSLTTLYFVPRIVSNWFTLPIRGRASNVPSTNISSSVKYSINSGS